jgi:hypothetical protein
MLFTSPSTHQGLTRMTYLSLHYEVSLYVELTWSSLNFSLHLSFFCEEATESESVDWLPAKLSSVAILRFFWADLIFWRGLLICINNIRPRLKQAQIHICWIPRPEWKKEIHKINRFRSKTYSKLSPYMLP